LGYLVSTIIQRGYLSKGYQIEVSPEAIAYNYLMALVRHDYPRAYGYLSPSLIQYPKTAAAFEQQLQTHRLLPMDNLDACVYLEESHSGSINAQVKLRIQYYDPCLWGIDTNNLSFNYVTVKLQYNGSIWQIIDVDGGFFLKSWTDEKGE